MSEALLTEIARLRSHYQSRSAHDQARRQLLDHFEQFANKVEDPGCSVCGYDCAGMPAPPAFCPVQFRGELARLKVKPREELRSWINGDPTGYLESDRDWLIENNDQAVWLLENLRHIQDLV